MTVIFLYVAACSAILAVVLAVARGVPILHLLAPPEVENEAAYMAVWFVPLLLLWLDCGAYEGLVGPRLLRVAWMSGLIYFWWCVGWHLRERRCTAQALP